MNNYKPTFNKLNYNYYDCNGEGMPPYPEHIPLAEINIYMHDSCMLSNHNFPCPICKTKPAVYVQSKGYFEPCWDCQKHGWSIDKKDLRPWWRKLF